MIISDKILYLRKKLGYTQEELAEQLNVSRQSISKWESAQSVPDISKIMMMADIFSVSTDYLLRDEIESLDGESTALPQMDKGEMVTIEIANNFIEAFRQHAKQLSMGVFLFIIAAIPLLILQAFAGESIQENMAAAVGLCFVFMAVVAGVGLCIHSSSQVKRYQYIMDGDFELSYNVSGIIKEYQKNYMPLRTKNLILGVSLIILSPIPLIISAILSQSEKLHIVMLSLLIFLVAIAVHKLICGEGRKTSYDLLLFEGKFRKNEKHGNKKRGLVISVYWSLAVSIYLVWSFLTNDWHITWLVWPVAGLLSTALNLLWINDSE